MPGPEESTGPDAPEDPPDYGGGSPVPWLIFPGGPGLMLPAPPDGPAGAAWVPAPYPDMTPFTRPLPGGGPDE